MLVGNTAHLPGAPTDHILLLARAGGQVDRLACGVGNYGDLHAVHTAQVCLAERLLRSAQAGGPAGPVVRLGEQEDQVGQPGHEVEVVDNEHDPQPVPAQVAEYVHQLELVPEIEVSG